MKFLSSLLTVILLLFVPGENMAQCDGRYQEEIFESIVVTNVQYGQNYNFDGQLEELSLDIYQPEGDPETERPLILLAHGGAFLEVTTRESGEIVRLCKEFARRGYVCASFDYRETPNLVAMALPEEVIKAIVRSIHDGKAAIRFFKRSAEEGNPYGIDPNQVILGGVSAGAILALNLTYLTDMDMLPWPWDDWAMQLGGLEGNSGNPGYNTDVIGLINMAGAIWKPYWVNGNDVPMLHIHGVRDPIVPYGAGKPLGIPWLPNLYGSKVIHERAVEQGIRSEMKEYPYRGHVPFLNFPESFILEDVPFIHEVIYDSTVRHIRDFAYSLLDCNPDNQVVTGLSEDDLNLAIDLYPNPTSGQLKLTVPDQLAYSIVEVFSSECSQVLNLKLDGKSLQTNLSVPQGVYVLRITNPSQPGVQYIKRFVVSR